MWYIRVYVTGLKGKGIGAYLQWKGRRDHDAFHSHLQLPLEPTRPAAVYGCRAPPFSLAPLGLLSLVFRGSVAISSHCSKAVFLPVPSCGLV